MQKVSYMGSGTTTEFYFDFPYFETSNVVVTKNSAPATGYNIVGNSGGLDADYPYIGGKVVFEVAPAAIDCITIARQLPLTRIADYQPVARITPTTLNQDLNYLMEVIKDRKDELSDLTTKYAEIADKESTDIILARITAIHEEITDIDAKIRALGDIGTLQQRVTDLTTTVGGHTTSISGLDTRTNGMIDYVVESQAPTAQNNYTWYRKYKSGWVEQGGIQNSAITIPTDTTLTITLPVEMRDTNYTLIVKSNGRIATSSNTLSEQYAIADFGMAGAKSTTSFTCRGYQPNWYVCGLSV